MAVFKHNFEVSFRDVDINNKLTNKKILECLEDIGGLHSDKVGYGFIDIDKTKLTWVLLNWKVRVFERTHYGNNIKVETWARGSTKAYTFRDFKVYDSNNKLIAIATSKWVLINLKDKRIQKITPEIINKYEPEMVSVFDGEPEINKITPPENTISIFSYTVQRKDIDINNHMHNITYLDLAYEALPEEVYIKDFRDVEIMYKRQIKLGETVKCFYSNIENEHYVTIKSSDETVIHAIVKLK